MLNYIYIQEYAITNGNFFSKKTILRKKTISCNNSINDYSKSILVEKRRWTLSLSLFNLKSRLSEVHRKIGKQLFSNE